jgi:hypothetical protein
MINIKSVGRDRIVYRSENFDEYHTHLPKELYNHPNKAALRLRYNVRKEKIPRMSKFIYKYVGKDNYKRFIESHMRISKSSNYINKLQNYIKVHFDDHNESYVNIQKGVR